MVSIAIQIFIEILTLLVLTRILLSWFRPRYRTRSNSWFFSIDEMVWRATEPMLAPIRNILPTGGMGLDLSPMILLLVVQLVGNWLVRLLSASGL
jgi:YggT family protein